MLALRRAGWEAIDSVYCNSGALFFVSTSKKRLEKYACEIVLRFV